jgi:hypothetical protein
MRQWVEAAYLTRAFVTRTHEYAFRKGSCDSLLTVHPRGAVSVGGSRADGVVTS